MAYGNNLSMVITGVSIEVGSEVRFWDVLNAKCYRKCYGKVAAPWNKQKFNNRGEMSLQYIFWMQRSVTSLSRY